MRLVILKRKITIMKTAGIVLLILGLGFTIFTGVNFFTKKKVLEVGKLEVTKDEPHYMTWSPVVGVVVMLGGAALLLYGKRQ
jgi:drug/metabolite transporter (DMT)-like permease